MKPKHRQFAVVTGRGVIEVRKQPIPALKDREVLIEVHASLISPGTEIALVRARRAKPDPKVPYIAFGYANAGVILATRGDVGALKPGQRVAAMGGGFALHATHACVPVNLVVPIPDALPFEQAAYATLAATALQSVRRTAPQLGEYGAVLGLGIMGNLAAQLYVLAGARIIAWEALPTRLRIARKCGLAPLVNFKQEDAAARTRDFAEPYGLDFANLAFGGEATSVFQSIVGCMKKSPDTHQMGRIVLVGGCEIRIAGGANLGNLDILASSRTGPGYHDPAYEYGQNYPNGLVPFTTQRNLRELVQLMAEGRLRVAPMTTHRAPLADVAAMVERFFAEADRTLGVVLAGR